MASTTTASKRKRLALCLSFGSSLDGGQGVATGRGLDAGEAKSVDDDGVYHRHNDHGQPVEHNRHYCPVGTLRGQTLITLAATCNTREGGGSSVY